MCESLETTTKAVDVMEKMDHFFQQNNIPWNHVGSLCTDGAPSMLGSKLGFGNVVKKTRIAHHIYSLCSSSTCTGK